MAKKALYTFILFALFLLVSACSSSALSDKDGQNNESEEVQNNESEEQNSENNVNEQNEQSEDSSSLDESTSDVEEDPPSFEVDSSIKSYETKEGNMLQMAYDQKKEYNDLGFESMLDRLDDQGGPQEDEVGIHAYYINFDHQNDLLKVVAFIQNGHDYNVKLSNTSYKVSIYDSNDDLIEVADAHFLLDEIEPIQAGFSRVITFNYDSEFYTQMAREIDWDNAYYNYEWSVNFDY